MNGQRRLAAQGFLIVLLSLVARAQDLASVRQALEARYALTTPTADKTEIVTAGDVLVLRKSNLVAVAVNSKYPNQNRYVNGKINQGAVGKAEGWLKVLSKDTDLQNRAFVSGEKLWLTGIDVRDTGVVFTLFSDPYQDVRYEARLEFPFDHGMTADPNTVQARIAEVFTVQPREQEQPAASPTEVSAPQPASVGRPVPMILLGQTPAQVTQVLGNPARVYAQGASQIYEYPKLRIVFNGGRVVDAQ